VLKPEFKQGSNRAKLAGLGKDGVLHGVDGRKEGSHEVLGLEGTLEPAFARDYLLYMGGDELRAQNLYRPRIKHVLTRSECGVNTHDTGVSTLSRPQYGRGHWCIRAGGTFRSSACSFAAKFNRDPHVFMSMHF